MNIKKIKKASEIALFCGGGVIAVNAVLLRITEVISYSEFKGAALVAGMLLGAAYAFGKINVTNK